MKLEYLECGKLLAPHGIAGGMKMECWCDSPAVAVRLPALYFKKGEGQYEAKKLLRASPYGKGILVFLEGVSSPEEAARLRMQTVYAKREDLAKDEKTVFLAELIGLSVIDADTGRIYGTLKEVDTSRKTTLYIVETEGGEVMLPAVDEFIKEVDVGSHILVRPIPGLFDEV